MPVADAAAPTRSILLTMGARLSTAGCISALRAIEKDSPSFTSPSACFRFAGVIRLTAPSWSSLPQRFQLESYVMS